MQQHQNQRSLAAPVTHRPYICVENEDRFMIQVERINPECEKTYCVIFYLDGNRMNGNRWMDKGDIVQRSIKDKDGSHYELIFKCPAQPSQDQSGEVGGMECGLFNGKGSKQMEELNKRYSKKEKRIIVEVYETKAKKRKDNQRPFADAPHHNQ